MVRIVHTRTKNFRFQVKTLATKLMSIWPERLKVVGLMVYIALAFLLAFAAYSALTGSPESKSKKPTTPIPKSTSATSQPNPADQPAPTPPASSAVYPSNVINLSNWKLTLPIKAQDDNGPEEIMQPQLASFAMAPYFQLNPQKNGVVFQAPVGGVTTQNSKYSRSELREMASNGYKKASWSSALGINTMTIRQAITHLPAVKNEVVAGQIHNAEEYIILIRLNGSTLFVQAEGENIGTLDNNYVLGTVFDVQISASNGRIRVLYNGSQKAEYTRSGSGYYFKAGCYTQSNPSKGDNPNDFGQVVIYGLQVSHTEGSF